MGSIHEDIMCLQDKYNKMTQATRNLIRKCIKKDFPDDYQDWYVRYNTHKEPTLYNFKDETIEINSTDLHKKAPALYCAIQVLNTDYIDYMCRIACEKEVKDDIFPITKDLIDLNGSEDKFELAGHFMVDAGLCWIGDPCYIMGDNACSRVTDWHDFCCKINHDDKYNEPLGKNIGLTIQSGMGDGLYPVYIREKNGCVAEVRILF